MKKITLLLILLTTCFGYSQNLINNGAFDNNTGLPKESHPPFPAEVMSPVMGASVESGNTRLRWEGSDIDNDIVSYTVLLDTSETPTKSVGTATTNSINVEVSSDTIYYWSVISVDSVGNESISQNFQFKVN